MVSLPVFVGLHVDARRTASYCVSAPVPFAGRRPAGDRLVRRIRLAARARGRWAPSRRSRAGRSCRPGSRAWSAFFTPGSETSIWSEPVRWISGSATPNLSTRSRMMSIVRWIDSLVTCDCFVGLAWKTSDVPPFRSRPSFVGFVATIDRRRGDQPRDEERGSAGCGDDRSCGGSHFCGVRTSSRPPSSS